MMARPNQLLFSISVPLIVALILAKILLPHADLLSSLYVLKTWYMDQLSVHCLLTKCITAAVISVAGDWIAQKYESFSSAESTTTACCSDTRRPNEKVGVDNDKLRHQQLLSSNTYDTRRGLATAVDSFFVTAPFLHVGYALLDDLWPSSSSPWAAALHVIADTIILDSLFVATTFVITGVFEGIRIGVLCEDLQQEYRSALQCSWGASLFLIPFEFLTFRYLHLSLRVLAINAMDLIWDTVVSFAIHRSRIDEGSSTDSRRYCRSAEFPIDAANTLAKVY